MRKESGITLIALVITIIILVILSAIGINLAIGQNGIIEEAQNSVSINKKNKAEEEITLAWGSLEAEYISNGNNEEKSAYFIAKKLNERLENGEVITVKHRINDAGDTQIIYKSTDYKGDVYHTINITSDGNISAPENPTSVEPKKSFAKTINESNYGDYVEYSKDLELTLNLQGDDTTPKTDWRIFYKDEDLDRVYLIAADYVPNNSDLLKLNETGMTPNGEYSVYWKKATTDLASTSKKNLFGINENSYILNKSKKNSRCVSTLLNTNYWNNFVDNTVADFAIGGPTIEMLTNSWNAKNYKEIIINSTSSNGYKFNNNTSYIYINTDKGYTDNLYVPHKKSVGTDFCSGYWIASPSGYSYESIIVMDAGDGSISNFEYNYANWFSLRPVVALKSGITATKGEDNIWRID